MKDFTGKIAVITGAATGMGRELALQLVRAGAHVAICDIFADTLAQTQADCQAAAAAGSRVSAHLCDVADEAQFQRFRDEVISAHAAEHVDLLFNNAGIGGGSSFLKDDRANWERVFNVSWLGVYYGARTFMPLLLRSPEAWIVNTSSVHGFLAFEPGGGPQSAYASAKFAIKGFSEALIADLRIHAPHVHVAVVMPGHVGTSIVENTMRSLFRATGPGAAEADVAELRARLTRDGMDALPDPQLRDLVRKRSEAFRSHAPVSAAQAASIILDGVRQGRWRILVGADAHALDQLVREEPERVYDPALLPRVKGLFPVLAGAGAVAQTRKREPEPAS